MALDAIKAALTILGIPTSSAKATKKPDKYIVCDLDGEAGSLYSSNKKVARFMTGTVDYFTKTEDDANVAKIETALNSLEMRWWFNSKQYEDDTGYHHWEWAFEVA